MEKLILIGSILLIIFLLWVFIKSIFAWRVIRQDERGVQFKNGRFVKLLGPGGSLLFTPFTTVEVVNIAPQMTVIAGQEMLTSDAIVVKISLAVKSRVVDPVAALLNAQQYQHVLYVTIQVALREVTASFAIEDLLEHRPAIDCMMMDKCGEQAKQLGVELERITVRDITLPGELKKTFAQVLAARKQAQAALEKARGETAALRSLANAASLIKDNPVLMQLRALQSLGESSGNSLVLGVASPEIAPAAGAKKQSK